MRPFTLAACAAIALLTTPARAQSVDTFEGLWSSRLDLGPAIAGDVTVRRQAGGWRASIGSVEARGAAPDFTFPENAGRLFQQGGTWWWIQPPGLPGQAYATPVRLQRVAHQEWRGVVAPLQQTFTLYMRVMRDEAGGWLGAFRNPEFNLNGGASRFAARMSENRLVMVSLRDGTVQRTIDVSDPRRLHVSWPPVPAPLVFAPDSDRAAGYAPRVGGPYAYAPPPALRDGWRTGRARDSGFDETALAAFVRAIAESDPAAARPNLLHSVLVARHGKLVLEEYFFGFDRDVPHDLRSAGKTLASLLLGAAMHDRADIGPRTRIADAIAREPSTIDPRKRAITLAHLMTHTSGLECDDNNENSAGNEAAMQGQGAQPDWRQFAFDLPMAHAPGERYAYCSGGMNLVGAALERVTGEPVFGLFDRTVARPLAFGRYHWNLAPDGAGYLGGGVYMLPRDLAKIGQLYLDGGVWNGRRIVDASWVAESTAPQVSIDEASTGMSAERFAAVATHGAEGSAWQRYGVRVENRRVSAFEANGNGGQFLFVVPDYGLVVVLTGGNYGQGGIWTRWRDEIVGGAIIAAIRDAAAR